MPPLDPFQFATGRQVKDPDGETFTIRARFTTENGPFLILSEGDSHTGSYLVPEGHVRDTYDAVVQEADNASYTQTAPGVNPALQTQTNDRLDRLESLLERMLDQGVAPAPAPAPAQDAPPAPVPPTQPQDVPPAVPPAQAPVPAVQNPPVPGVPDVTGPQQTPTPAPGPAAISPPAPDAHGIQ